MTFTGPTPQSSSCSRFAKDGREGVGAAWRKTVMHRFLRLIGSVALGLHQQVQAFLTDTGVSIIIMVSCGLRYTQIMALWKTAWCLGEGLKKLLRRFEIFKSKLLRPERRRRTIAREMNSN